MWLADTVVITSEGLPDVVTGGCTHSAADVMYEIAADGPRPPPKRVKTKRKRH